jgi:hypothetical protein
MTLFDMLAPCLPTNAANQLKGFIARYTPDVARLARRD